VQRHAWLGHVCFVGRWAWRAWVIVHWVHWPF
jgi:hypothetical protein